MITLVALLTESVDWNSNAVVNYSRGNRSLSSRRAWIEIRGFILKAHVHKSLSSRRAWIEMSNKMHETVEKKSLSSRRAWIEICLRVY